MKRKIALLLAFVVCISCINVCSVFAANPINVEINGNELVFFDQRPVNRDGRVLVPLRSIFEALGADVQWDGSTQTAIGTLGDKVVKATIGSTVAYVGNETVTLDVGPQLINDRTMVPVRFVSESLGAKVDWISETQTVTIEADLGKTGGVPNIHPKGTKRPVPTNFEKSSEMSVDNLLYFKMPTHPDDAFRALGSGEVVMTMEDFLDPEQKHGSQGMPEYGSMEVVEENGEKFYRLTCTTVPADWWGMNIRYKFPRDIDIETGDMYVFKAKARLIEGGQFDTQQSNIGLTLSVTSNQGQDTIQNGRGRTVTTIGKDGWTNCYRAGNLDAELHAKDPYYLDLTWDSYTGVVEVKDLELIIYKKGTVNYEDLPGNHYPYKGSEQDAQWRKDALERIEKIRKGDINVIVKDSQGNVIPDAQVNVDMFEHEFLWSDNQDGKWDNVNNGLTGMEDNTEYEVNRRKAHVENFNSMGVTIHKQTMNDEDSKSYLAHQKILDWANANGIDKDNRGHALFWDYDKDSLLEIYPEECFNGTPEGEALLKEKIREHIFHVAEVHPTLDDIDVTNEDSSRMASSNEYTVKKLYGNDFLIDIYKYAREAFPDAKLALTDGWSNFETSEKGRTYQKPFLDWAVKNLDFDIIGNQGHTSSDLDPEKFIETLNQLASYGKPIHITEFDCFVMDNPELQGNVIRDALICYFACEGVEKIQTWGANDFSAAGTQRPLYYFDYLGLKPGGEAFQDLVYNKWWTKEAGKTDTNGAFKTRGYYGDYTITASANGNSAKLDVHLGKNDPREVVIVIE